MSPTIKTILWEVRASFEKIYGKRLKKLVLFGSQARGDAQPGSDIDILVVLDRITNVEKEIADVGDASARLSLKYDVVISCTFASVDRYEHEQSPLFMNVRKEGIAA